MNHHLTVQAAGQTLLLHHFDWSLALFSVWMNFGL
jgi:hypothetical protein